MTATGSDDHDDDHDNATPRTLFPIRDDENTTFSSSSSSSGGASYGRGGRLPTAATTLGEGGTGKNGGVVVGGAGSSGSSSATTTAPFGAHCTCPGHATTNQKQYQQWGGYMGRDSAAAERWGRTITCQFRRLFERRKIKWKNKLRGSTWPPKDEETHNNQPKDSGGNGGRCYNEM